MTMATCLSRSFGFLQDQDLYLTCRLRRRQEKLGQGGHGLWSSSFSPKWKVVEVVMVHLLENF